MKTDDEPEAKQSLLFRPVFRKKEERKGRRQLPKKNAKQYAIRPSTSSVKLVFDFEEEANQSIRPAKRNTNPLKRVGDKAKNRSSSEDEWVEAPQQPINRPKASDLI
jgi:hypothetical protein